MAKKNNNIIKEEEEDEYLGLRPETKQAVFGIMFIAFGAVSVLSFFHWAGIVGVYIDKVLGLTFGWLRILFIFLSLFFGYALLRPKKYSLSGMNYFGLVILVLSITGLAHLFYPLNQLTAQAKLGHGGGWLGVLISYPLLRFTSFEASLIILLALFFIAILIAFNTTFERLAEHVNFLQKPIFFILFPFKKLFHLAIKKNNQNQVVESENQEEEQVVESENQEEEEEVVEEMRVETEEEKEEPKNFIKKIIKNSQKKNEVAKEVDSELVVEKISMTGKYRQKIDLPIDLLNLSNTKPVANAVDSTKEKIAKALENFGIVVEMGEYNVGPTVTQYTFRPADGVKLNRITSLNNDLSLALAAHPIRIEAPIPGRSLVGIEVPNKSAALVTLREIVDSKEFKQNDSRLTIGLGKDVKGNVWVSSLDRMPHVLIAGATGSGKSVCVNNIIVSLLYQNGPDDLKFIMVDPKRVELKGYDGIPHLITPVITDVKKTINALKWCLDEMDRRFDLLSKCGHRNIVTHNNNSDQKLPYIVFIIDELADLMAVSASDVEAAIIRLSQMARAVGIHLVLATQRPSVDVITGLIKANITSRIAFSVASLMDSRTILDTAGAEKLIGRGDMLFMTAEIQKPKRIQGAYLTDEEIKRVVDYLKQQGEPDYAQDMINKVSDPVVNFEADSGDDDELLEEAKEIIIRANKASASLLQRRLKVGYARAARLLDILEEKGVVGPSQGAKPRDVLVGEEALSVRQSYGESFGEFNDGNDNSDEV